MKISFNSLSSSKKNQNNFYNRINFKSHEILDTTEFYRSDFDIDEIIYYIDDFYKNDDKISLIFYGCSNAKEVYSFSLRLKLLLYERAKKFESIVAKDIDAKNILKAKIGRYKITKSEEEKLDKAGGILLNRYIDILDDGLEKYAYIRDPLKTNLFFAQADICDDLGNIPSQKTFLICRNFWSYLDECKQIDLAKKLGHILDESSHILLGSFDKIYRIPELLEQYGFAKTNIEGLMKKCRNNTRLF